MNIAFNLFWLVVIIAILVLFYFIKECFFKDKDTFITTNIIDKYPSVNFDFINKSIREQNIENNQEIHDKNRKIEELNNRVEKLEHYVEVMNNKIEDQLKKILEEIEKRG